MEQNEQNLPSVPGDNLPENKKQFSMAPNMKGMLKQAVPLLKTALGLDLDEMLQKSLQFLPAFFKEKIAEYEKEAPDLRVSIMITLHTDEATGEEILWLVPVGTKGNQIQKEFEPINLNVFLGQLNIEQMLSEDDKTENN